MVKTYWNFLPAFHVAKSYGEMVPLRHAMVSKNIRTSSLAILRPSRPPPTLPAPAFARGVCFYHRVSQGNISP